MMRKILAIFLLSMGLLQAQEVFATYDVVASKSAKVAMQTSGIVLALHADVGDMVQKGELLAELDSSAEQIELALANSALEFAKSSFEKLRLAKDVSSKQSFDTAKFNYDEARIRVQKISDIIAKKRLYAPFSGVISAKLVEVGEGVGAISQPLFILEERPNVKLLIGLDAKYANKVKIGDEFKFKYQGEQKSAKITAIVPNINTANQKIYLQALSSGVLVGEFGEGSLEIK